MTSNKDIEQIKEEVKDYYGKTLKESDDLLTNACCTGDVYPDYVKKILAKIHDEVHLKYYGCGLTVPLALEGMKVLDLGSGAGRDCYIVSALVGEKGEVVGVDMTIEQLDVANKHLDYHRDIFSHKESNVTFLQGEIEKLDELNLEDNYFDIVISNCVINLSADKEAVLKEVYRVLKPGGEMYFSDVYSDRRVPANLVKDPILYGECLSGALYTKDFVELAKQVGFNDTRLVDTDIITMKNEKIETLVGDIKFHSNTYRLFKISSLEYDQEDYGHKVSYKGTIAENSCSFKLDNKNIFTTNQVNRVSSNTFSIIKASRLNKYFDLIDSNEKHKGSFSSCCTPKKIESKPKSSCC